MPPDFRSPQAGRTEFWITVIILAALFVAGPIADALSEIIDGGPTVQRVCAQDDPHPSDCWEFIQRDANATRQ